MRAMQVATDLGAPAVAGIEEGLLRDFGQGVLDDRTKQMIGHMVRAWSGAGSWLNRWRSG